MGPSVVTWSSRGTEGSVINKLTRKDQKPGRELGGGLSEKKTSEGTIQRGGNGRKRRADREKQWRKRLRTWRGSYPGQERRFVGLKGYQARRVRTQGYKPAPPSWDKPSTKDRGGKEVPSNKPGNNPGEGKMSDNTELDPKGRNERKYL